MIPVFYRPEQSSDAAASYSPSAGKPRFVVDDWHADRTIAPSIDVRSFEPADRDVLALAHRRRYVAGILGGRQRNGFNNTSKEIAKSLCYTVGSIVAATKHVLTAGSVAVSPTSGFHHAGYDFGGGFCTFNGLMVAAMTAHAAGARRILILDMDQHYGNGTDDIIGCLGLDYVDHVTAEKSYRTAAQALAAAGRSKRGYDLVLYQAGADIHVDDPLGGLLTTDEMTERDARVFRTCAAHKVPLVWNLAGGYQRDADGGITKVIKLHRNTMRQCVETYGEWK